MPARASTSPVSPTTLARWAPGTCSLPSQASVRMALSFVPQATDRGAAAVLSESEPGGIDAGNRPATWVRVSDARAALAAVATAFYDSSEPLDERCRDDGNQRQDHRNSALRGHARNSRACWALEHDPGAHRRPIGAHRAHHNTRGARSAGGACRNARRRMLGRGDRSFLARARVASGRRRALRSRRIHQPDPRPPRLPWHHGGLSRGQGKVVFHAPGRGARDSQRRRPRLHPSR